VNAAIYKPPISISAIRFSSHVIAFQSLPRSTDLAAVASEAPSSALAGPTSGTVVAAFDHAGDGRDGELSVATGTRNQLWRP
jgi:hypothetical protein